jgi:hypothetical protein
MAWYVVCEGSEAVGPVEEDLIERGILTGKIPLDAQICGVGESEWKSLASVKAFAQAMRAVAPPPPSPGRSSPPAKRREYHTLSDVYPLATAAPPYIPGPARLPSFDGKKPQAASRHRTDPPPPFGHGGAAAPAYEPQRQIVPPAAMEPAPQPVTLQSMPMQQMPATMPPSAQPSSLPAPNYGAEQPVRGPLLAAVILTAVSAVFWFLVVLTRILVAISTQQGDLGFTTLASVLAVGLDIWIVAALWGRKRAGYTFGLPTHLLNAVLGLYHLFGSAPFIILIVPVHAFAAATIWAARHELASVVGIPNPAVTAKITAQKVADLDTTRVLLALAGIVAIAVSILFLIFLARQH